MPADKYSILVACLIETSSSPSIATVRSDPQGQSSDSRLKTYAFCVPEEFVCLDLIIPVVAKWLLMVFDCGLFAC